VHGGRPSDTVGLANAATDERADGGCDRNAVANGGGRPKGVGEC
jgi:hypothetical protein